jgi:methylenetetrahydrofolate--tRNA-(uracil-5-)-methyltransferase
VSERVSIIGGGLAGCEAAWQLARRGVPVDLYEMRPIRGTEAHLTDSLAELVCSNSFRNATLETAVGLLKEEMRQLGSLIMRVADANRVPAGACLAVDRIHFAAGVTRAVEELPNVRLVREEVTELPAGLTIVATGPLTSPALSAAMRSALGTDHLYFYDAIAPIVSVDSVDMDVAWKASRYGKGGEDYINCPLDRAQYYAFVEAVTAAEKVPTRDFERCVYFEGCMPIEEMARRGRETLAFGPMRPVGLGRPARRQAPVRVRPAPPGRRRGPAVQHGRLPDQDDVPGAAARVPHDPGPRARRVRAPGQPAPQHVRQRAGVAHAVAQVIGRKRSSSRASWSASRGTSNRRPPACSRA